MTRVLIAILSVVTLSWTGVSRADDKPLKDDSLYNIGSNWINEDGKEFELKELTGKPTILALVYLTCQYLCPTIISEIEGIENRLDESTKKKVQVLIVSFDPEKDTPQVMKAYRTKRKLDREKWIFITHKKDQVIRQLAAALDFKYQKIDKGDYSHSFMINVLDKDGVLKAKVDKANQDKATLVEALNKIANAK